MSRFTLEIGSEAIPAGYVPPALETLRERMRRGLEAARLDGTSVSVQGTAKRLVLFVEGIPERQEDVVREVQGPRAEIAFRDGAPTPAAVGFAKKNGVPVESLERVQTDKGELVLARVHEAGRASREILPGLAADAVAAIAWPKTMVWEVGRFRFPRPLRWIVSLLDRDVLPFSLGGIEAGRTTRGHRLLGPGSHEVPDAGALVRVLDGAGIVLDAAERTRRAVSGLTAEAERLGGRCLLDDLLLAEVAFLTEHPVVHSGSFDREFLELPREVVVTAMKSHQRYFAVEDASGALLPYFLVVCDGAWKDPSQVIAGNERVLRARLADARFYWQTDLRTGLDGMASSLKNVVWLEPVGTLHDKAERVEQLVERLGRDWFASDWEKLRADALRAARIAKADLASEMIQDGKEFTGLQGRMGARYAEASGESAEVVRALAEQYRPQGAGDTLPESRVGLLLSVADRFDTIAGCWASGFVPTGSEDPYALRRAANGIVRILLDRSLGVSLSEIVSDAVSRLPEKVRREGLVAEILEFFRERVAFFLRERGVAYDTAEAVLAADSDDPWRAELRARALDQVRADADLGRLVAGFKRAANILKGVDAASLPRFETLAWTGADPAETALRDATEKVSLATLEARARQDYPSVLRFYLELRDPIDSFFEKVMVMSPDPTERDRRLALLVRVRAILSADFDPSRIVIEGAGT